jgi:predicted  nucleic acid-binding Zn-ribbon protein
MGIVNKIVNILVLILAIASAVLAFMLFSKKDQILKGWKDMAQEINKTAKILDTGSTETVSSKLANIGNHKQIENLKALAALDKQAKAVVDQRDALAEGIKEIATKLVAGSETEVADLQDIKKYADGKTEVMGKIDNVVKRNNAIVAGVVATAKSVGVTLDPSALKSEGYINQLQVFKSKVDTVQSRHDKFESHIKNVADILGQSSPSLSGSSYASELKSHADSVTEFKEKFDKTEEALTTTKQELADARKSIEDKDNKIAETSKQLEDQTKKCARLEKEIAIIRGDDGGNVAAIIPQGATEALKRLKGKVVEINDKWNFVVIDLGKKSKYSQSLGMIKGKEKFHEVDAPLPDNENMIVARSLGKENELIGKIKIVKVYDYCAICNVLPEPKTGKSVQVGDVVYFGADTIKKFEDAQKGGNNKVAEAVEEESK